HIWWTNGAPLYAIGRADLDGMEVSQQFIDTLSISTGVVVNALVAPSPPGPGAPPPPTIMRLVDDVQGIGLPRGTERSLVAKLGAAQVNLAVGDLRESCDSLRAFLNEVRAQTDKKLDGDHAEELVADATTIRRLLGCSAD